MNFGGPLLYSREAKCSTCPQKYGCVKYLDMLERKQTKEVAENNQVLNAPVVRKAVEPEVSETRAESSDILSSITGAFEKINQDLVNQNNFLRDTLASMEEEISKLRSEVAEVRATPEINNSEDKEPDDSTNDVELVSFTPTEDGTTEDLTNIEKALELYKKNNQTILREKRTIFGTKKWVEEKVT